MDLDTARALFDNGRGYLSAASAGLPPRPMLVALRADLDSWQRAQIDPKTYDGVIARTRESFARLVGVATDRVAIGSQTSVLASVIAAAVPAGAEVLCVDGDFSSMVFPFLQRADVTTRSVPLAELATSVGPHTWLVAFSHVQSATGEVAEVAAIVDAAHRFGARTMCDLTQSAGVHPVDASVFDATVCHAYKWLCSPRGAAFLTVTEDFQSQLTPVQAGWFAGDDPWASCYGPHMSLAADARRFDVSPAWQAWVGAEVAIGLFADLDVSAVWTHASGLGDRLCDGLDIPRQGQAIVTWTDASGADYATLTAAGVRVASRAGRLRAAFHLWNDETDVGAVLAALGRPV